jgi:hypothetical protein
MHLRAIMHAAIAAGVALSVASCSRHYYPEHEYTGPGCLIHLFTLPNLQGAALPVVKDTPEVAEAWHGAASAKIIYGTWRLFAERDYKGFMGDYTAPANVLLLTPTGHLGSLQCIKPEPEKRPPY